MKDDGLEQLTREELIALVRQLRADIEDLRKSHLPTPPTTSKNSSLPPSRDHKCNRSEDRLRRKHGTPAGHAPHMREWSDHPDEIVTIRPSCCSQCQTDLTDRPGTLSHATQITEIPEPKAQVIEVRHELVPCPHCGHTQGQSSPPGLERERQFGARLEATIVYYRHTQHMSYERTAQALWDLYRVVISEGGIDQVMKRAGLAAEQSLPAIIQTVQTSAVIHSDETSARVNGRTSWQWVFWTTQAVLHCIAPTRRFSVIESVMGNHQAEVWVSDCLAAQMKVSANHHQICLAHQLRDLQKVIDRTDNAWWARTMQTIMRAAIHLHHERETLSGEEFAHQCMRLERICDWLLARSPPRKDGMRLCRRYRKYRASLFVFLHRTDVEPTNNVAERALRPSVVHRKVSGGFRSEWGATAYAALCSVIDTARLQEKTAFETIQSLMGHPALPIPSL